MTKQKNSKKNMNKVAMAITGAVVGAGIAVAGAVALKSEKNRKKLKNAFTKVKDQVIDSVENIQEVADDKKAKLKNKVGDGKEKLKKISKVMKS